MCVCVSFSPSPLYLFAVGLPLSLSLFLSLFVLPPSPALNSSATIRYAERAKKIQNKAEKQSDSAEVAKLKQIIAKMRAGELVDDGGEGETFDLAIEESYKGDATGEASTLDIA